MLFEKSFKITLATSLLVHMGIFLQNPHLNLFSSNNNEKKIELSYVKPPIETKPELKTNTAPAKREPLLKIPSRISADKKIPPPFIDKESIFRQNRSIPVKNEAFTKPIFTRPDVISIKKRITIPAPDLDKINNPSYLSYYQIVREKIKRAAYQNYAGSEVGEVSISFIIADTGLLKELRLVEEKSSLSPYLREIALRSVKDASSFPAFPKELDYPQLSFNLTITFEIE